MKILLEVRNGKFANLLTTEDCELFIINHDDHTNKHLQSLNLTGAPMVISNRIVDAVIAAASN